MFQRLKGAIDRTIAEEQARLKNFSEQSSAGSANTGFALPRRSTSTTTDKLSLSPHRRSQQNPSDDTLQSENPSNPDPAVFEKAFKMAEHLDFLTEQPSITPESGQQEKISGNNTDSDKGIDSKATPPKSTPTSITSELSIEIRSRLRKLEKIEGAYTELLRSYRIAHGRALSIEPFERVLKEHTPLTSIHDPDALVEYLNQLNLKGEMVMDELKRVSNEKASLEKHWATQESELKAAQDEINKLKSAQSDLLAAKPEQPVQQRKSAEFFSFDSEVRNQGSAPEAIDVVKENLEIQEYRDKISILETELAQAKSTNSATILKLEEELAHTRDEIFQKEAQLTQSSLSISAAKQEVNTMSELLTNTHDSYMKEKEEITMELSNSQKACQELRDQLQIMTKASESLKTSMEDLESTVTSLTLAKKVDEALILELTVKLNASQDGASYFSEALQIAPVPTFTSVSGSADTNTGGNKKKKDGAGNQHTTDANLASPTSDSTSPAISRSVILALPSAPSALEAEVTRLEAELASKENQIKQLTKRYKDTEILLEEIETLRDELLEIGQEHVVSKAKIKDLTVEKTVLEEKIRALEEVVTLTNTAQKDLENLRKEHNDLKTSTGTLKSDLAATEALAQTRFHDLSELREILQRTQPELKSLRQDAEALIVTRQELAAKTAEIRDLERCEKEIKSELNRTQRISADREAEIKTLRERLAAEERSRLKHEDAQRLAGRDIRRAQAEKIEIAAREEKTNRELQKVQEELYKLRTVIHELEDKYEKLEREHNAFKEDATLKNQQHHNLRSLVSSMREETSELRVQLREAQSQADTVSEELIEVQGLLGERTCEAETMRRLLADVDERANTKVHELRTQLELVQEERDRMEDESSALARRKTREIEELKSKLREVDKETKKLVAEQGELESRRNDLRRLQNELESQDSDLTKELDETRLAVSDLRTALEASEKQLRDVESHKDDLCSILEDMKLRYEGAQRDLKAAQVRLGSSNHGSSMESTHIANTIASTGGVDPMYIKTILLQFLEQREVRFRVQLVPVLGRLLNFTDADIKKWTEVVQNMGSR